MLVGQPLLCEVKSALRGPEVVLLVGNILDSLARGLLVGHGVELRNWFFTRL